MTSNPWFYLVKDLGFPIAMCLYFMLVNNKTIKRNTDALIALEKAILIREGQRKSL